MKKAILGYVVLSMTVRAVAMPVVDPSTVVLEQKGGVSAISYNLSGAPAVITIDIQTNAGENVWASIGDGHVLSLKGDVNRLVQPSQAPRRIEWKAHKDWPGHKIPGPNTRAVVEVWPTNHPPQYMVFDLENAAVEFYRSETAIPYAVTNDLYVTKKMVFCKIPAANATMMMGTASADLPKGSGNATGFNENQHKVHFTEDFYMAIYPMTQEQRETLTASPCGLGDMIREYKDDFARPQVRISYDSLRGAAPGVNWPQTGHQVSPDSVIGKIRNYFGGMIELDLPTEAQWEYACRAGTTTLWYFGSAFSADDVWSGNKTSACDVRYSRNPWGIYGMYGNCANHCLDLRAPTYAVAAAELFSSDPGLVDPCGASSESPDIRMTRGGNYACDSSNNEPVIFCRSAARYRYYPNAPSPVITARFVAPARLNPRMD